MSCGYIKGCVALLVCSLPVWAAVQVAPYVSVRSLATNAAREMVGCHDLVNRHDACTLYANFFIQPGYTDSFKSKDTANLLFGGALNTLCCGGKNASSPHLHISGSHVAGRAETDLLADYFGLPVDFESDVYVHPRISNFFFDVNLYMGLDDWAQGLYFKIFAPFIHTRWELNACERNIKMGESAHLPGYMSDAIETQTVGVPRIHLLNNFSEYAIQRKAPQVGGSVIFEPLAQARWYDCVKTDNRLADLHLVLGWNFKQRPNYHVGISLRTSAATGTRPYGEFLFEPIAGNGRHWELGAGLDACWQMWHSADEANNVSAFFELNMMHLFRARQFRTFDLCSKPLSRYMLVQRMTCAIKDNLRSVDDEFPSLQFDNVLTALANVSTLPVRVRADFQTDLVVMLAYTHNHVTVDLGYNFFDRTRERIMPCFDSCSPIIFQAHPWALKGDAFVYGFTLDAGDLTTPVALSPSQAPATISQGTNNPPNGIAGVDWNRNPGVDNKNLAQGGSPIVDLYTKSYAGAAGQVNSSFSPRRLTMSDLDTTGTKLRSQSVFFNVSHTWDHREDITPYLGFGAQVEMGIDCKKSVCERSPSDQTQSCASCSSPAFCDGLDTTIWQWAVWLKGGVAFK